MAKGSVIIDQPLGAFAMRARESAAALLVALGLCSWSLLWAQEQPGGKSDPATAKQIKAQRDLKASPLTMAKLRAARTPRALTDDSHEDTAGMYFDGTNTYAVVSFEFDNAQSAGKFALPGAKVITRFDKWVDAFVPASTDEKVFKDLAGLVWFDYEESRIEPPPARPIPRKETPRSIPEPIVQDGIAGLKGKGVIIAVIDSGIDFY